MFSLIARATALFERIPGDLIATLDKLQGSGLIRRETDPGDRCRGVCSARASRRPNGRTMKLLVRGAKPSVRRVSRPERGQCRPAGR